ncbi:MAG: protein kinase [Myxococcota bacterium]
MGSPRDAYELGGVAGEGRTTLVRLGVRRGDSQPVALKQLRTDHVERPGRRVRFIEQAQRASLLDHETVERIFDVLDDRERPLVVAEWIDGRALNRLIDRRRTSGESWSPEAVTHIATCLLEALRHAHQQLSHFDVPGVMLHGGIAPRNVLVDIEGNIKLVGFGMASVWQEAPEPWQDLETLRYLSADHARRGASPASDLYAVGAIVHELLSGKRFRDECKTEEQMREAIDRLEPPPRPRKDVPSALERLRRRLLEPAPNPRMTLEHMLDICAAVPVDGARTELRDLVREALRMDSTQTGPTPVVEEDAAVARSHKQSVSNPLKQALEQVPIGKEPRRRGRDTQSVPVPVDHEQTAPRRPLFLQQTAPPQSDETRDAEQRRSGRDEPNLDVGIEDRIEEPNPQSIAEVDTAPLSVEEGAPQIPMDDLEPLPITEPKETDEIPRAPEHMQERLRPKPPQVVSASGEMGEPSEVARSWLQVRGPLGWALVGALGVGIGLPLAVRCSAGEASVPDRSAPTTEPER